MSRAQILTPDQVSVGDSVEWISPRECGTVVEVDYCCIKIQWKDGTFSVQRKADGFVGWKVV